MILRAIFLIAFLGYSIGCYGQDSCDENLVIQVKSSESNQGIPYANVILKTATDSLGYPTDANGSLSLKELCTGLYTVTVSYVGFETVSEKIELPNRNTLNVILHPNVQSLGEVTVETEKVEEIASLSAQEVTSNILRETAGETLGQALQSVSGVNLLQTGPTIAKPIIHGLHSNRILILNNGIRQEGQQWGQEHAPEIDPFVANNLKLIKGAAAVKYGSDAIGGVILVNPSDLPSKGEQVNGKVNLVGASNNGLYAASALVEGSVNGLSGFGWRIQGTHKRAGDARAADYRLSNTATREDNFSIGLGYHKGNKGAEIFFSRFDAEIGILRSAHIGNLTDLGRALESDRPLFINDFSYNIQNPYQAVTHSLLKINGHVNIDNLGDFSIQYGFQDNRRKEFDIRRAGRSTIPSLSLELQTHTLDFDLDMSSRSNWKSDVGISFMYQSNSNVPGTGIRPLIPNFDNVTAGLHFITRYIKPKYELEFGVRYDYRHYLIKRFTRNNVLEKPEFDFNNVTGSIGAIYFIDDQWTLRSNIGTAWRAPHVNELYSEGLHHGAAAIEEGDPTLESEKAIKWITSLEKVSQSSRFSLSGYINLINDYIILRPEGVRLTVRGAFPLFTYRQTDAIFLGMDLDYDAELSPRWDVNVRGSLIYAEERTTNGPLINIPANQLQLGLNHSTEVKGLQNFKLGLNINLIQEQLNAPRMLSIQEVRDANFSNVDLFETDPRMFDFVNPPAGYALFGLNAGFDLPLFDDNNLNVLLSVDNLFNKSYRSYLNRFRYYADEMGRNFTLRLFYEF